MSTTTQERGARTYLSILRTTGVPAWLATVVFQRLPIAMSPLALIFLGKEAGGSYALGALLAGLFALAEAAFAGVMGRRFDRNRPRREMQLVLGLQALALAALGAIGAAAPAALLIVLAIAAGGVASGAHGGLRALLVRTVPASAAQAALSLEATLTTLTWAVGPALVAALAVLTGGGGPVIAAGALAALGVIAAGRLHDLEPAAAPSESRGGLWGAAWPSFVHEAGVMLLVGTAYATLPALLESTGASADLAGPALAGFAAAGIVGGLVYGTRSWPGAYRTQVVVLLLALSAVIGAVGLAPSTGVAVGLTVVAGLAGTPTLIARAAGLQELLPASRWAVGFSGLYAAGGVGFGLAGLIVAPLLESADPGLGFIAGASVAAVAALVGGVAELRIVRPAAATG